MNEQARLWLAQAMQDMETSRILLESARFGPSAFFAQQVAEKALKAALYGVNQRPWGHSLPALLDQVCDAFNLEQATAPLDEATALDEHYLHPRYPDAASEIGVAYDQWTAAEAREQAQTIMMFVQEYLSDDK